MKKKIMGILAFSQLALFIVLIILRKIINTIGINVISGGGKTPQYYLWLTSAIVILSLTMIVVYVVSVIIFFVYNWKNLYITHDKRVGWGYMLIFIGVAAMPAYWYNFLRKK